MWLSRFKYEQQVIKEAQQQALISSNQAHIAHLTKEVDYWREKFEESLRRADRIHDNSMQAGGFAPVSDTGLHEAQRRTKAYEKGLALAEKQNNEMFGEEIREGIEVVEGEGEEEDFEIDGGLAAAVLGALNE